MVRLRRSASPRRPTATGCDGSSTISLESRLRRFFTPSEPSDAILQRLVDAHDPAEGLTLIVDRYVAAEAPEAVGFPSIQDANEPHRSAAGVRPIATASYLKINDRLAEVAFAVDDHFQGKGLGSMLLERLAVIAWRNGANDHALSDMVCLAAAEPHYRNRGFIPATYGIVRTVCRGVTATNERPTRRRGGMDRLPGVSDGPWQRPATSLPKKGCVGLSADRGARYGRLQGKCHSSPAQARTIRSGREPLGEPFVAGRTTYGDRSARFAGKQPARPVRRSRQADGRCDRELRSPNGTLSTPAIVPGRRS